MWVTIRKWIIIIGLLSAAAFLGYEWFQFRLARDLLPPGTEIASIDVSGLTREQARQRVEDNYLRPVYLYHREEHVELDPRSAGFQLDLDYMFGELDRQLDEKEPWLKFVNFILDRPLQPIQIPLSATHDRASVEAILQSIADLLDQPAQASQMLTLGTGLEDGMAGYSLDQKASVPIAENVLYQPENRAAQLIVIDQEAPEVNMAYLGEVIESKLQGFDGLGSFFIMDLETGEELAINADVAMSGLSILKIAIFVEAYRALDQPPDDYVKQLFMDTATRSSNFGANLLLHIAAGENNTYLGADILTESMHQLGLVNTFMAVPYDATPPAYRQTTYVTPANSRTDITTQPDPTMQSTAEEIGTLLSMIYYCAKGGGPLLAVYPEELTPQECQAIIDLMVLNEEGNLIRFGVPEGTPVSHKHGWANATHADAGIVFSPGGDYVIVEYLNQPGDWLLADVSFPILREIARATFNYFNMDDPYLVNVLVEREQFDPENPFSEQQFSAGTDANSEANDGTNEVDAETGDEISNGEAGGEGQSDELTPTPSVTPEPTTNTGG